MNFYDPEPVTDVTYVTSGGREVHLCWNRTLAGVVVRRNRLAQWYPGQHIYSGSRCAGVLEVPTEHIPTPMAGDTVRIDGQTGRVGTWTSETQDAGAVALIELNGEFPQRSEPPAQPGSVFKLLPGETIEPI